MKMNVATAEVCRAEYRCPHCFEEMTEDEHDVALDRFICPNCGHECAMHEAQDAVADAETDDWRNP